MSCFLLGGRAWAVLEVRHDDRRVVVGPAPRGKQPTWGGFIPQFLSEAICRKIRDVLASDDTYSYLTPEAAALLAERRDALGASRCPRSVPASRSTTTRSAGGPSLEAESTPRSATALGTLLAGVQIVPDNFLAETPRQTT